MKANLRSLIRTVTPQSSRRLIGQWIEKKRIARLHSKQDKTENPIKISSDSVIVSSWWTKSFGIARGAQCTLAGLERANVKTVKHDLNTTLESSLFSRGHKLESFTERFWLIHCNAPEAASLLSRLPPETWQNSYRIGYWAYELPVAPKDWIDTSRIFHEIWVPSQFVANALKDVECPVKVIPHYISPLHFNEVDEHSTTSVFKRLGLNKAKQKTVGVLADLKSSAERKNIFGAIDIFLKAYPQERTDIALMLKLSSPDFDSETSKKLEHLSSTRQDIIIVKETFSDQEYDAWLSGIDVILSPHRAEGYGLVLAEALIRKIPVLATGWSGNMDFMKDLAPFLIDYDLVPVRDFTNIYKNRDDQYWADPIIDDAANKLKKILDDPDMAKKFAEIGCKNVEAQNAIWLNQPQTIYSNNPVKE